MRALTAILTALVALITTAGPLAFAQSVQIGTVDVTRALNEVAEGQAAQARLDIMFQGKQAELEQMEADLMAQKQEYDAKVAVLSDAARQEYEQKLYQGQMAYQQTAMGFEQQMQGAYLQAMESLTNKMKTIAGEIAQEKGFTLVLEVSQGVVLYAAPGTDITDQVIARYNAAYPSAQ